jgi:hypothetical protein
VSATPQLQVIKLKNYDVTFDNATAPAFIALSPDLRPPRLAHTPNLKIVPPRLSASAHVSQRRQGFPHDQSCSGFHVFIRHGQLYRDRQHLEFDLGAPSIGDDELHGH